MGRPPRRILMTVDAVGGVWRYALTLAGALRDTGIEVHLVGLGPRPTPGQEDEAAAQAASLTWLDLPLTWMAREPAALAALPATLAALARRLEADLLHLNEPAQADGLVLDRPVVGVSHSCLGTWFAGTGRGAPPAALRWQIEMHRRGMAACDALVTVSAAQARLTRDVYGPIAPMQVVPNAIADEPWRGTRHPIIFAAARWWDAGKNAAVLDEAAGLLARPVLVAGPETGPDGAGALFQHAVPLGALPAEVVLTLMRRASIVVSPSLYEPFGLAALEGARAGAALVLADIPTYRELWEGAALFADPLDPDAFAEAIAELCARPARRAELAEAGRERSLAFTPQLQAAAMAAIYAAATPGAANQGKAA